MQGFLLCLLSVSLEKRERSSYQKDVKQNSLLECVREKRQELIGDQHKEEINVIKVSAVDYDE